MAPRAQHDAVGGEPLDGVGHNLGLPAADGLEEVSVRCRTQALVPGIVIGGEMFGHGEGRAQMSGHTLVQQFPHGPGAASAVFIDHHAPHDVAPPVDFPGHTRGQPLAHCHTGLVPAGHGGHVRGGSLHHAHAGAQLRQGGHERHGRGSAADHNHPPIRQVSEAGPVRGEALVVAVVPGGHEEPPPGHLGHLARVLVLVGDGPRACVGGPLGALRPLTEADVLRHPGLIGGRADVGQNGLAGGQTPILRPRTAAVPESSHVR